MIERIKDLYYTYKQNKLLRKPLKNLLDYMYTFDICELKEVIFKSIEIFLKEGGIENIDWSYHNKEEVIKRLEVYIERRKKYNKWIDKLDAKAFKYYDKNLKGIKLLEAHNEKATSIYRISWKIEEYLVKYDEKYLKMIVENINYFWT